LDLRSPEFHQALESWFDQLEEQMAQIEVDRFLEDAFDLALLSQERLVSFSQTPSPSDHALQTCYVELQERAQVLIQEICERMGPTCLGWLNRALMDLEAFRNGGAHPGYLVGLLRGEAEWIGRHEISGALCKELEELAQNLASGPDVSGTELRDFIESLTQLGVQFGEAVARSYETNLHVALREAGLASSPEERAEILAPVHHELGCLSRELEGLRAPDLSEKFEHSLDQLLDQMADLDDSLAAVAEGEHVRDLPETLSRLHKDMDALNRALDQEHPTQCSVCGQHLAAGVSRCEFCSAQAPQRVKPEVKVALVAALEREIQNFESGYSELLDLTRFLDQEFRRVVSLGSKNTKVSQTEGLAQIKRGYAMLLEVESPGDSRIHRGLDLVQAGAKSLETLT
jgi:primosomal protein N''